MKAVKTTLVAISALAAATWIGYGFYQAYQPQPLHLQGQIESQQYQGEEEKVSLID